MKHKRLVSCVLSVVMILLCTEVTPFAALDDTDKSVETYDEVPIQANDTVESNTASDDVIRILTTETFDKDTVLRKGLDEIELIATTIDEFNYWKNPDIVDFRWLHSFKTGLITYALFEIIGENGQPGYMIYDCELEESDSFSASASPYALAEESLQKRSFTRDDSYYFYTGVSYGCGVLNEDKLLDIYELYSLMADEEPSENNVLRNVSFQRDEIEKTAKPQGRILIGSKEAVLDYERRRDELDASTTN